MNIQKTNKIGIELAKYGFIGNNKVIAEIIKNDYSNNPDAMTMNTNLLRHNPKANIIRVSKGIMEAAKLIDIDSIKENINESNFDFTSMFILLDNDKSGVIRVERYGSDFSFFIFNNLALYDNSHKCTYNTYSFITRDFYFEKDEITKKYSDIIAYEKSVFVIQLLTYLIFGDITKKHLPPKAKTNIGSTRFLNNSKLNITFCDSLWKQRISVDGFKVRGHFRLQPCGEEWKKRKLIWIEEFEKQGYNRKATVELIQTKLEKQINT